MKIETKKYNLLHINLLHLAKMLRLQLKRGNGGSVPCPHVKHEQNNFELRKNITRFALQALRFMHFAFAHEKLNTLARTFKLLQTLT